MKSTRAAALLAALMSAAAAGVLAAPAQADDQMDPVFLQAIHDKGLSMPDSTALKLAHGTCGALGSGNVNNALAYLKKNSNLSDRDAIKFGGIAITAYCRQSAPKS